MSDFKKLKEFIKIAKDEGVAELKYEHDDDKFFVSFSSGAHVIASAPQVVTSTAASSGAPAAAVKSDNYHEITSPFVGTFYASPAPGKPSFAKVGDRVSKGATLCILEAMKIMNEIESDVDGEIVEICVDNESLVEFGQTLFKIKA